MMAGSGVPSEFAEVATLFLDVPREVVRERRAHRVGSCELERARRQGPLATAFTPLSRCSRGAGACRSRRCRCP